MPLFVGPLAGPQFRIAMSARADGAIVRSPDVSDAWLRHHGFDPASAVRAGLVHGTSVRAVDQTVAGQMLDGVDGLTTNESGLMLLITVADCLPIFLSDPAHHAIGLVHAGWRGLAGGIITESVQLMSRTYGSVPADMLAGIGPAICARHYPVGDGVARAIPDSAAAVRRENERIYLDLRQVGKNQLMTNGIQPEHIEINMTCTFEDPTMFSYRRDRFAGPANMLVGWQYQSL